VISNEHIALIQNAASKFRRAIEASDQEILRPVFHGKFPRGACGDASDLLATYLYEQGVGHFEYVLACRGSADNGTLRQHAWLEQDGLIVDITADQFQDAPKAVIVSANSDWH